MEIVFISYLVSFLFSGFQITVIVLLILKLIFKKHDLLWSNLFMLSNCILLFASLLYGIVYLWGLNFYADISEAENSSYKWQVRGFYWYAYWIVTLLQFLVPQILWIKKYRKSYRTSLAMIPFLCMGGLFERAIIIIATHYKDYLPSSWTYYAPMPSEILVAVLIFSFVLMVLYFVSRKSLIQIG